MCCFTYNNQFRCTWLTIKPCQFYITQWGRREIRPWSCSGMNTCSKPPTYSSTSPCMVQREYQTSFKALSGYPRVQDNHKISPLAPFHFLVNTWYRAFSLELFSWQVCFNLQFCWTNSLLFLFAVIPSFPPTLPPEQNPGFPPLDTLPYKHMLLQISWWSTLWPFWFSKIL